MLTGNLQQDMHTHSAPTNEWRIQGIRALGMNELFQHYRKARRSGARYVFELRLGRNTFFRSKKTANRAMAIYKEFGHGSAEYSAYVEKNAVDPWK